MNNNLDENKNVTAERLEEVLYKLKKDIDNKEDFTLNITHDMRSHLNVIISALQFIEHNNLKIKDEKKYMNIIRRNSYKILKLINNLIDTSKLENNYYKLKKRNIDIVSMIEGTVECVEKYSLEKNIQLIFDTNKEECIVSVDPEAIDRIVMNLLSNAIKFSPIGSEIKIYTLVEEETVSISVTDEGPGIKKEDQEIIFNRFAQASQVSKGEHSGSGIGLDLVNCLVKLHNGRVELNSDVGKGSTFTIILPIEKIDDNNGKNILINKCKEEKIEIEFSDIYL